MYRLVRCGGTSSRARQRRTSTPTARGASARPSSASAPAVRQPNDLFQQVFLFFIFRPVASPFFSLSCFHSVEISFLCFFSCNEEEHFFRHERVRHRAALCRTRCGCTAAGVQMHFQRRHACSQWSMKCTVHDRQRHGGASPRILHSSETAC